MKTILSTIVTLLVVSCGGVGKDETTKDPSDCADMKGNYKISFTNPEYECGNLDDWITNFATIPTGCTVNWNLSSNKCQGIYELKCPRPSSLPGSYKWTGTLNITEDASEAIGKFTLRYYDGNGVLIESCSYDWVVSKW